MILQAIGAHLNQLVQSSPQVPIWEVQADLESKVAEYLEIYPCSNRAQKDTITELAFIAYRQQRLALFENSVFAENRFRQQQTLNASSYRVTNHLMEIYHRNHESQLEFIARVERIRENLLTKMSSALKEAGLKPIDWVKNAPEWAFREPPEARALHRPKLLLNEVLEVLEKETPYLFVQWRQLQYKQTEVFEVECFEKGFINFGAYGATEHLKLTTTMVPFKTRGDLLNLVAWITLQLPKLESHELYAKQAREVEAFERGVAFTKSSIKFRDIIAYEAQLRKSYNEVFAVYQNQKRWEVEAMELEERKADLGAVKAN